MITFQLESWRSYYGDPGLGVLWQEHYDELAPAHQGRMEMSPDVAMYQAAEAAGSLVIVTARAEGRLVGYCLAFAKRHPHYNALCGFEDSYFLTRRARRGTAGVKLIKHTLSALARRGCKRTYWMTKEFASIGKIFHRLGMVKMDEVYCSWTEN